MLFCRVNNSNASGDNSKRGFIVYKGSSISDHTTKSFNLNSYYKLRNELIENGIIVGRVFVRDYIFSSSSAAACVISGRMISGLVAWREIIS